MRIVSQIAGLQQFLLNHLARVDAAALESAVRLATGKIVNQPADDPAAFFRISSFENRLSVVKDTKAQVDVAASVGAENQLALDEIRTELNTIRSSLLLDEDQTLTAAQRTTEQAKIDTAIETIGQRARTEVSGRRFLDGSANYRLSGKNVAQLQDVEVYALNETTFSGNVSAAATQAQVTYAGAGGTITDDATFTLTGKRGTTTISVTNGEALSDAVDRINQDSHDTGIAASVNGDDIVFTSVDYGDAAKIDIDVNSGTFNTSGTTQGSDAVVTINGQSIAAGSVDGNRVTYAAGGTHVVFEFQPGFTGDFDTVTVSDEDVARFALSTNLNDVTRLAVSSVLPELLGGVSGKLTDLLSGGSLAGLGSNTAQAIRVVDEALAQLDLVEGQVDAFADVAVASASSLLDGLTDSLEDTLDTINGVNEDEENLVLQENLTLSTNTLAAISILQQQQTAILAVLQNAAGL